MLAWACVSVGVNRLLHFVRRREVFRLSLEGDGENAAGVHLLLRHVQVTLAGGAAGTRWEEWI